MVLQIYQRRHKNINMDIASKRRRNNDQEIATISDPISNLPKDVIKTIFSCLPIRDAVRSSILSKIWRYRWAKLVPHLILEGSRVILEGSIYTINNSQSRISLILFQLMLHHEGPIKKFTLVDPGLRPCPEIDSLIFFLLRNGLEDLILYTSYISHYKLPLLLFKYQQLRELNLTYCIFAPAPTFKGFSRLSTLKLSNVTISNQVLNGLISGSPLLNLLDLNFSQPCNCKDIVEIEIDAPKLKSFSFKGIANSLIFKNVPLLAQVSIAFLHYLSEKRKCNLAEFFHCLPALQDLHIGGSVSLTFLAIGEVPTRLPNASLHITDLTLENVVLSNLHYLSLIFCLIRSSLNLNYINITFINNVNYFITSTSSKVIEVLEENTGLIMNQLEQVTLNDVTGKNYQLEFIKLLLANSPNLKCMMIYNHWLLTTSDKALEFMKQVKEFQRATNKGRVLFGLMSKKQDLTIGSFRGLARTKNGRPYIEFEI